MDIEIVWNAQDQGFPVEPLCFFDGWNDCRRYLAAVHQGRVVGLVCYTDHREGILVLSYLDVAQDWQAKGVATRLAQAFLDEAKRRAVTVGVTPYSEQGTQHLKPVLRRMADAKRVALFEDWTAGRWALQCQTEHRMAA